MNEISDTDGDYFGLDLSEMASTTGVHVFPRPPI